MGAFANLCGIVRMDEYFVPAGESETEYIEKRSRFIARIWRTDSEAGALEHIRETREKHWDAAHNVYAYVIRNGAVRYSDDGEPQGTAGMPVLNVLSREELFNVCCVVTRYFGGVLLGAGGLARAYGGSAKQALDKAGIAVMRRWTVAELCVPYSLFERIKTELEAAGGHVTDTEFSAEVLLKLLLPAETAEMFALRISELSAGALGLSVTGETFRASP